MGFRLSHKRAKSFFSKKKSLFEFIISILKIPGGKPKIWRAVWTQCYKTLENFNSNMENINVPKAKVMKTPVKNRTIANETIFSTPTVGTPRAQFTSPT